VYAPSNEQRILDVEHLRLLRIGYFVSAGVTGFYALFGLVYMGMGAAVGSLIGDLPVKPGEGAPPEFIGWIFAAVGGAFTLCGGVFGGAKLYVARCLRERKAHGLCIAVAVFTCLEMPYGTVLGAFTFTVLTRPSVKELFGIDPLK
jgi:hypothetical protein